MAKKFYAIKLGKDPITGLPVENLIVTNWAECESYVKGVKGGAKYKGFSELKLAEAYLFDSPKLLRKGEDTYPEHCIHLYVDGSYNKHTEKYSFSFVAVKNNIILHIHNGTPKDNSLKHLQQIAGELESTIKSVEYALSVNENEAVIFYDYMGIFEHSVGTWDKTDESSKQYSEIMNGFITNGMNITFVKVDSHTGDIYNEIADSFAKLAAEVEFTNAVDKWLNLNELTVLNDEVKMQVLNIIQEKNSHKVVTLS